MNETIPPHAIHAQDVLAAHYALEQKQSGLQQVASALCFWLLSIVMNNPNVRPPSFMQRFQHVLHAPPPPNPPAQ